MIFKVSDVVPLMFVGLKTHLRLISTRSGQAVGMLNETLYIMELSTPDFARQQCLLKNIHQISKTVSWLLVGGGTTKSWQTSMKKDFHQEYSW